MHPCVPAVRSLACAQDLQGEGNKPCASQMAGAKLDESELYIWEPCVLHVRNSILESLRKMFLKKWRCSPDYARARNFFRKIAGNLPSCDSCCRNLKFHRNWWKCTTSGSHPQKISGNRSMKMVTPGALVQTLLPNMTQKGRKPLMNVKMEVS